MVKCLRRISATIAILIALSVIVPLAFIEGNCRPAAAVAASSAPGQALPAINEQGYRRKEANTFFTFPEWYIVYSFEDFGHFLDSSSESQFGYLSHILGFWRSFCTINRAVPATGESLGDVKSMIYVIGVSYSAEYAIKGITKTPSAVSPNGSEARHAPRRTTMRARCCRTMPRFSTPSPGTNIRSARSCTA